MTALTGGTKMLTASDLIPVSPFIEGRSVLSHSDERHSIVNPACGEWLYDIPVGHRGDVDSAVTSARRSFSQGVWRELAPSQRKKVLHRWADSVAGHAKRLDGLDALEMGKPIGLAAFNAEAAASLLRFNAEALDKISGEVLSSECSSTVLQLKVPRGVVGAIVPWNFPTYNVLLKAAPALAAGNSVVLKPSELASQTAFALASLALEAGLPPGVLNVVPGRGEIVGRAIAEHPGVDMLTFTGSTQVGKLMLEYAGRSNMKVVSAECGGKSPHLVFNDGVDLGAVAQFIAGTVQLNQGQVCSVGSRVLVQESARDELVQRIVEHLKLSRVGNPQLESTNYGPLVSRAQFDKVLGFIASGIGEGARLVYGGDRILADSGGFYLQPTLFVDVPKDSRIAREEIFGPVLSIMTFRELHEAIELARHTSYGLAAYVWSTRMDTGFQVAKSISTAYTLVTAQGLPAEGPGHAYSGEPAGLSGTGIEGGMAGLETYLRRQTIWVTHGNVVPPTG